MVPNVRKRKIRIAILSSTSPILNCAANSPVSTWRNRCPNPPHDPSTPAARCSFRGSPHRQAVNMSSTNQIVHRNAPSRMRGIRNRHGVVRKRHVRVMVLTVGHACHRVHKRHRVKKVGELVRLGNRPFHPFPSRQAGQRRRQLILFQPVAFTDQRLTVGGGKFGEDFVGGCFHGES